MVEWIKCEDDTPKDERYCLCLCSDGTYGLGFYSKRLGVEYNGEYRWVIGNEIYENVIAWADLTDDKNKMLRIIDEYKKRYMDRTRTNNAK